MPSTTRNFSNIFATFGTDRTDVILAVSPYLLGTDANTDFISFSM